MKRALSKSKLVALRQCPKRLWLEVHRPELREDSAQAKAKFKAGNQVGDIARQQYDPRNKGVLLDAQAEGFDAVFDRTRRLLDANQPIFEAAFRTPEALAFADVLLPVRKGGKRGWKMVEVKSATTVKDYHRDDAAIQVFIARATGVSLVEAAVACIDSSWVYQGDGDYAGLLAETDVTVEALSRGDEVKAWIAHAHRVVAGRKEPDLQMGRHCNDPFECSFSAHCMSLCPAVAHPISLLPGALRRPLQALVHEKGLTELGQVPDELLNDKQQRVKQVSDARVEIGQVFARVKGDQGRPLAQGGDDLAGGVSGQAWWKRQAERERAGRAFDVRHARQIDIDHRLGRAGLRVGQRADRLDGQAGLAHPAHAGQGDQAILPVRQNRPKFRQLTSPPDEGGRGEWQRRGHGA